MVVKSATKKKLTDLGVDEEHAHLLADDRKWDDVKILNPTNSRDMSNGFRTAQSIHTKITTPIKSGKEILRQPQKGENPEEEIHQKENISAIAILQGGGQEFPDPQEIDTEDPLYQQIEAESIKDDGPDTQNNTRSNGRNTVQRHG